MDLGCFLPEVGGSHYKLDFLCNKEYKTCLLVLHLKNGLGVLYDVICLASFPNWLKYDPHFIAYPPPPLPPT